MKKTPRKVAYLSRNFVVSEIFHLLPNSPNGRIHVPKCGLNSNCTENWALGLACPSVPGKRKSRTHIATAKLCHFLQDSIPKLHGHPLQSYMKQERGEILNFFVTNIMIQGQKIYYCANLAYAETLL